MPRYEQDVARNRAAFPLTARMPVNIGPCSYWHYRPTAPPPRVTSDGAANVLLVQNLRDPATPHSGALKMRQALGDRVRMVSVDSGGHGSYLTNGNACGDHSVTEFLVTGTLPRHDTLCTDRSSLDGTPGSKQNRWPSSCMADRRQPPLHPPYRTRPLLSLRSRSMSCIDYCKTLV